MENDTNSLSVVRQRERASHADEAALGSEQAAVHWVLLIEVLRVCTKSGLFLALQSAS